MKTTVSSKEGPERGVNRDRTFIQCRHFETQTLLALCLNSHKSIITVFIICSIMCVMVFNTTFVLILSVILTELEVYIGIGFLIKCSALNGHLEVPVYFLKAKK
jgi:hypothetical protein